MSRTPHPARRHGSETLHRIGVCTMAVGAAFVVVPAFPADRFADVRELLELTEWQLWQRFTGVAVLLLGNTLRLIGAQGHPGLPWPLLPRGVPPELSARIQIRRRAWENRAKGAGGSALARSTA